MRRRDFLTQTSLAMAAFPASSILHHNSDRALQFGLIADPHADLVPDHMARLEKFMEMVDWSRPDFIIQLGDFCFPKKDNQNFLSLWNQYRGPKYHVLGNHDMDVSSKEETMGFWGMPARYYSRDERGFHLVVLDANNLRSTDGSFLPYDHANFYVDDSMRTYIDDVQLEWLRDDLAGTSLPTLVFSHQSLCSPCWGIKNRVAVQRILEEKNEDESSGRVLACFNGHDHIDHHRIINSIHYIEVNSMAYQWVGSDYSDHTRFAKSLYDQYPNLDKMAPYQDSLYALVTVDLEQGSIRIEGQQSSWVEPSPREMGMIPAVAGCELSPHISSRTLTL